MMGLWEFMTLVFPFSFMHLNVFVIIIIIIKNNPVHIDQSRLYSENENAEYQRG